MHVPRKSPSTDARWSIDLPSPSASNSPKAASKPKRGAGRGANRRESWRKEADRTATSNTGGRGNAAPTRGKDATPDTPGFGDEEDDGEGEMFDVWTEEEEKVNGCDTCGTPFPEGSVVCSNCKGGQRQYEESEKSDQSGDMSLDLTVCRQNSRRSSLASADEPVQKVERKPKRMCTHDLTSARDLGHDTNDAESNASSHDDYDEEGGNERKGMPEVCAQLVEAQRLNKKYESRIAELEKSEKRAGRADTAALANMRDEFTRELEERDDREQDLECKSQDLESRLSSRDAEIKKYRSELRQAKNKLHELENRQNEIDEARDQGVELAITRSELQEARDLLADRGPRAPSSVETALTAELAERQRELRKTKRAFEELENQQRSVLGDLENEVFQGKESRRVSQLEISEHSKRLLQLQLDLEYSRSQAEMTNRVSEQLLYAKEELTAEKQLAAQALRDSNARSTLELSSLRQENIIQNAREIEALRTEIAASKKAAITAEGKFAANARRAEQTAESCTREAEDAIAETKRLELRIQKQSLTESMAVHLEDRMVEVEARYGEACGEAATWRDMNTEAQKTAEQAQRRFVAEVSMCTAQKHQLHEAQERARNASGVQTQVGEALSALAAMRKELSNAREEEWRQGHAFDLLNETREELHDTEELEQETHKELEVMRAFKAKFTEAESALKEARSKIDGLKDRSCQADHALIALPEVQLELAEVRAQYFDTSSELIKARQVERDSVDAGEALIAAHTELSNVLYQKRLAHEAAEKAEYAEKMAQTQRQADARKLETGMYESRELKSKNQELKSVVQELESHMETQKKFLNDSRARERSQESRLLLLSEALDDSEIHFREAQDDAAQLGRKLDESTIELIRAMTQEKMASESAHADRLLESHKLEKQMEDSRFLVARATGEDVKPQPVVSKVVEPVNGGIRFRDELRASEDEAMEAQRGAQRLAEALDRRGRPLLDFVHPMANNIFDDGPSQAEVEFLERLSPDFFGSLSPVPMNTSDIATHDCSPTAPELVAPNLTAVLQTPMSGRQAGLLSNGTSRATLPSTALFSLSQENGGRAFIAAAPNAPTEVRGHERTRRFAERPISAQPPLDLSQLPLDQTTRLQEQMPATLPLLTPKFDPAIEAMLENIRAEHLRRDFVGRSNPTALSPDVVNDSEVADVIAEAAREAQLVLQDMALAKSRQATWPELPGVHVPSWPLPWPPPEDSPASGLQLRKAHEASLAMVQQSRGEWNAAP